MYIRTHQHILPCKLSLCKRRFRKLLSWISREKHRHSECISVILPVQLFSWTIRKSSEHCLKQRMSWDWDKSLQLSGLKKLWVYLCCSFPPRRDLEEFAEIQKRERERIALEKEEREKNLQAQRLHFLLSTKQVKYESGRWSWTYIWVVTHSEL